MQTQQYCAPFHQSFYQSPLDIYHAAPDHYFATDGLGDSRFSRGSSLSYPHQDFQVLSDRGGPPRQSSSSLAGTSLGATGMAITDRTANGSRGFRAEGIADYHEQQQWYWPSAADTFHGVPQVAPAPGAPEARISMIKRPMEHASVVLSPAAQLPTPASMAVLLNPHVQSEQRPVQDPTQPPPQAQRAPQPVPIQTVPVVTEVAAAQSSLETPSREKKHGCTMCHKR
jgi:hypothetical protein